MPATTPAGPAGLVIRAYEPEDLNDLHELLNQPECVQGTLRIPMSSRQAIQQKFEATNPLRTSLVAVIDDKVVGHIALTRYEGRRAHAAHLGLAVHDSFQGRGIGRALLQAVLNLADNWLRIERLELEANADNQVAIRLYQGMGFEQEGLFRRHAYRDGAWVDTVAMARLKPQPF